MTQLAALLFDVDGTMAETEDIRRLAMNEALRKYAFPWVLNRAAYAKLIQRDAPTDRLKRFVSELARDHDHRALELLPELMAAESKTFIRMLEDGAAKFRPGVVRLIEEARARGLRIGLVSAAPRADLEALIIANLDTDGPKRFDVMLGAEDAPPAERYPAALRALDVNAEAVIAFEDSGICLQKALAANIRTVVTPSLFHQDDDFTGALAVISHLGEPFDRYEHLMGTGAAESMVTVPVLRQWLADDDDMRGLLMIGGRSIL